MKITEVFHEHDLDNSFLLGYYGGGNYGDELLLEILQNIFYSRTYRKISILYQNPKDYARHHHDFGYQLVSTNDKPAILRSLRSHRNIIVGGGGLWGLDMNFNTFLMSLMLFIARWLLNKKVFLIGVGYYNSTTRLGRVGAWLAGKAATVIIARDDETYRNFKRLNPQTFHDADIAWYAHELDLKLYESDLKKFEKQIDISSKALFITLRRFKNRYKNDFTDQIAHCIARNTEKNIIAALLEPKETDPESWRQLVEWQKQFPKLQVLDFSYNPLTLYLFFKKHHRQLIYIGPQFHGIITAHLSRVPFLPVVYDNKVKQLFNQIGQQTSLDIRTLRNKDIQNFINRQFKKS